MPVRFNALKHGETAYGKQTGEYRAFQNAKTRCMNKRRLGYKNYGGRGIKFQFISFEQFLAEVGRKPSPRHVLDRRNNDGHYKPGNVRWITKSESNKNRRKKFHVHRTTASRSQTR